MSYVSPCCNREIIVGRRMEYPLGGSQYGIAYKVDICAGCGIEVEDYQRVEEEEEEDEQSDSVPAACEDHQ